MPLPIAEVDPASTLLDHIGERPGSVEDLVSHMDGLIPLLGAAGLGSLNNFAVPYRDVTVGYASALDEGSFRQPDLMKKVMCGFDGKFLDAVEGKVTGNTGKILPAWRAAFVNFPTEPGESDNAWKIFLLGLNAHVHADLPRILLETDEVTEDFAGDYFLLNKTIQNVSTELAPGFMPRLPVLLGTVQNTVFSWRRKAWRDFRKLSRAPDEAAVQQRLERIDAQSMRCAGRIIKFSNFIKPAEWVLPEYRPELQLATD